jgi:anti-sigma regulatory factor (Ser/Thr protein kinase)
MPDEVRVAIASDADMVPARAEARVLAEALGFSRTDATLIATAVSEVARNIVAHVGLGEIAMVPLMEDERRGLRVVASDQGPGIRDIERALEHGYTSRSGLGLGLSGARRLMDDFEIASGPAIGTTVTMTKWRLLDALERLHEERRDGARPDRPAPR